MARYIDADKLIAHLKDEIEGCKPPFGGRANGKSIAYGTELGLKSAISFAETLSTADVAPKSEVANLIYKLECLLCHATGGKLSKHSYDLKTMETAVNDYINESYEEGYKEAQEELYSDVERLDRICHSYALQYGTVTDQQKVIDKAKAEVAREIFEEIETSLMIESFHGSDVYYAIRAEDYLHYKKKYTEGNR